MRKKRLLVAGSMVLLVMIWFLFATRLLCVIGCGPPDGPGPHPVPHRLKFDLAKVGASYEFQVNVMKPGMYAVGVSFYTRYRNEYSKFFDTNQTLAESAHLFKMMGSTHNPATRKWTEIGMPATFRVQIMRNSDRYQLFDRLITRQPTGGTYMGRYAILTNQHLLPGIYTARVSYLDGICDLFPLKGVISFYNTLPPK